MLKALGSRMTYANVMATVAVFLALGGGAYAVSGIPDRGGTFHACVSNATGVLRVVKSTSSCHRRRTHGRHRDPGEFAIAWNQVGRQGPQGLPGQPGSNATLAAPEAFHEVGSAGQPPFLNSWANATGTGTTTAGFYKDPFGVVHLKGFVSGGSANAAVFNLPDGYRPTNNVIETVNRTSGEARLVICGTVATGCMGSPGDVFALSGSASIALDGATFRAGE